MPLALKQPHAAVKNYYAAAMKSWQISTASVVTSNLDFNNLFSGIWVVRIPPQEIAAGNNKSFVLNILRSNLFGIKILQIAILSTAMFSILYRYSAKQHEARYQIVKPSPMAIRNWHRGSGRPLSPATPPGHAGPHPAVQ
jgi:hypothetical protein